MSTGGRHNDVDAGETAEIHPAFGGEFPVGGRSDIELAEAERAGLELADDPFDDDLAEQLAAKAPRSVVTRSTLVFAAVLLAVGGFAAGTQVQKRYGEPATAAAGQAPGGFSGAGGYAQGRTGQRAGGAQPGGQQPGAGEQGGTGQSAAATGSVTGTVKLVDGTTVYIETSDGQTITVKTSGDTTVQTAQPGKLADLTAGATVTVEGQRTGDTLTATKLTKSG